MPLFGFRKDKKHEQSHVQSRADLAKSANAVEKQKERIPVVRTKKSVKPQKISGRVTTKDAGPKAVALPAGHFTSATDAIIRPRVTEKSGLLSQSNVYTFEVSIGSNKATVVKAIKALYKVTPVKIAIVNTPAKNVFVKGRRGTVAGMKKAMVTIKPGEKIDFV